MTRLPCVREHVLYKGHVYTCICAHHTTATIVIKINPMTAQWLHTEARPINLDAAAIRTLKVLTPKEARDRLDTEYATLKPSARKACTDGYMEAQRHIDRYIIQTLASRGKLKVHHLD